MLRYLTAGESHGPAMLAIVEGLPHGLPLSARDLADELGRRRLGYGRGGRMKIEGDEPVVLAGVRLGKTLGSPLAVMVSNRDHANWLEIMPVEDVTAPPPLTVPRPGHADLAGALKYRTGDIRNVLERASARETVGRVCAGTAARLLLRQFGIEIISHVTGIGPIDAAMVSVTPADSAAIDSSPLRCLDAGSAPRMQELIDDALAAGDSLGGRFEVLAFGVLPGLGSYVQWDRRLDAAIARSLMSIPAIKAVSIGDGEKLSYLPGSEAHDAIVPGNAGIKRLTNRAGGIEGGISNGERLVVRAAMKPIPTLARGVTSVDIATGEAGPSLPERADVCAVPAAAVIAESCLALTLTQFLMEKLGGDSLSEMQARYREWKEWLERFPH